MIRSMTAFIRSEIKFTWGIVIWELRSVNHRYLDIYLRLPDKFINLEPIIRKKIRSNLYRGKIECNLHYKIHSNINNTIVLNEIFVKNLINSAKWINNKIGYKDKGKIDPITILRWPGVIIEAEDKNLESIREELINSLNVIIIDFIHIREKEGIFIKRIIEKNLDKISIEISKIRKYIPEIIIWQRKKILQKFKETEILLDNHRLEQELVFLAQKSDITEEVDRLEMHIKETFYILEKKEPIGRRLDFMMQELHRESNTLSAKSINSKLTKSVMEIKVLVEQMREQVQNIE